MLLFCLVEQNSCLLSRTVVNSHCFMKARKMSFANMANMDDKWNYKWKGI